MKHAIYNFAGGLMLSVFLSMTVRSQGLHLTPGIHVVVSGAPQLVLNSTGLTNDGELAVDSSNFLFTGNMPFIGGRRPVAFYDLAIGSTTGNVQLNNHIAVIGHVYMQGGILQLNQHMLELDSSGIIVGECSDSYITGGKIRASALLNAPYEANPGNIGIALTSDADLGWTTFIRGNEQQTALGIQRYFDINPEKNASLPVSYRLYYLEGELAGKSKERLALLAKETEMGTWADRGKDQTNPTAGWVMKSNIRGLHHITLGIPDNMTKALQIFPNPSFGVFRMIIVSEKEEDKIIRLYDGLGHLLQSRIAHCMIGKNIIEWNGARLAQGSYWLDAAGWEPVAIEIIR